MAEWKSVSMAETGLNFFEMEMEIMLTDFIPNFWITQEESDFIDWMENGYFSNDIEYYITNDEVKTDEFVEVELGDRSGFDEAGFTGDKFDLACVYLEYKEMKMKGKEFHTKII